MYLRLSPWVARSLALVLILYAPGTLPASATDNQPPEIEPITNKVVQEYEPLSFAVEASDPDGDDVDYGLVDPPAGMTIDPNGIVRWTPGSGTTGVYSVTVQATDEQGALDEEEVAVVVEGSN
jgi:Putative Ig domain